MSLFGKLKVAGGEKSLGSLIGRWRVAMAVALDALLDPPYIEVRRATSDQNVDFTAESDLVLNVVSEDGGVTYDTATGVFTLEAGLYELEFFGTWVNFGTPNTTAATAQWVSHPSDTPLATGLSTWVVAASSTLNNGSQPVAKALYRAAVGQQVKVKASSLGGGGTADLLRGASYACVRKVA